jgi:hypothetical protein
LKSLLMLFVLLDLFKFFELLLVVNVDLLDNDKVLPLIIILAETSFFVTFSATSTACPSLA